ncbi:MAG TPA: DUF2127 domain-containing protein [Balneolales bacterium]|nr:DUF2127 domain-containing protein [Balneolales bacterium]
MQKEKKRKLYHELFIISIIIKGIDGFLELIGGIILYSVKSRNIVNWVHSIFRHELAQDPKDFIANFIIKAAHHLSHNTLLFAAIYLFLHGLIKISLVTALWLKKIWAYPLAGIILFLFVVYELYRYSHTHSLILLFLIIIDVIIVVLLRFEYIDLRNI